MCWSALAGFVVSLASALLFSGCAGAGENFNTAVGKAYQSYDQNYDRELQFEATTDGSGTIRYVIKPRRSDGKTLLPSRGNNSAARQFYPNVVRALDGFQLAGIR